MLASRSETAASLPTGTVTFLFTDIQTSTRLWEQHPSVMRAALIRHDALIEELVGAHAGWLVRPRGEGDSRFAVFEQASAAIASARCDGSSRSSPPRPTTRTWPAWW